MRLFCFHFHDVEDIDPEDYSSDADTLHAIAAVSSCKGGNEEWKMSEAKLGQDSESEPRLPGTPD